MGDKIAAYQNQWQKGAPNAVYAKQPLPFMEEDAYRALYTLDPNNKGLPEEWKVKIPSGATLGRKDGLIMGYMLNGKWHDIPENYTTPSMTLQAAPAPPPAQ